MADDKGTMGGDCRWHIARPAARLLETGLVLPRKGAIKKLLRRMPMSPAERAADIAAQPDRAVMRDLIHPTVAARGGDILYVGVQAYTRSYISGLESAGGTCWTLDYDVRLANYGAPGRHTTGSAVDIGTLYADRRFRSIVISGVLGFGVNRLSDQIAMLGGCAAALEDDGLLVLGWNDRRVPSVLFEEATARWFDFRPLGALPARIWVTGYDHNFAFLQLKPEAART